MGNTKATPPPSGGAAAGGPSAPPSPFRYQIFTVLWFATVFANIGTWMHDAGAAWLMTTLSPSPAWVALVQTATAMPVLLLALPAGALADCDLQQQAVAFHIGDSSPVVEHFLAPPDVRDKPDESSR